MTNEERDIITRFIERVGGAQGSGFGSAPGAAAPALPPIDRDADALIGELFSKYPEARYRLTQTAFVQEHALAEAQNRIQRLDAALQQAQQAAQAQPKSGGFLSGLFGGGGGAAAARPQPGSPPVWNQGAPQQAAPQYASPPPQYAPGPQQGMFQRSGSGFLGSALTTAAGVAGGMVAGNALMNLFSPHTPGADLGGGGFGGAGAASPWGSPEGAADPGYVDQGSWTTPDAGSSDQASWGGGDAGGGDQSSWDAGGGGGDQGSWDTGGGGFDDNNS